jgi:hypothetical protein
MKSCDVCTLICGSDVDEVGLRHSQYGYSVVTLEMTSSNRVDVPFLGIATNGLPLADGHYTIKIYCVQGYIASLLLLNTTLPFLQSMGDICRHHLPPGEMRSVRCLLVSESRLEPLGDTITRRFASL